MLQVYAIGKTMGEILSLLQLLQSSRFALPKINSWFQSLHKTLLNGYLPLIEMISKSGALYATLQSKPSMPARPSMDTRADARPYQR